jgi:hypothetical protein
MVICGSSLWVGNNKEPKSGKRKNGEMTTSKRSSRMLDSQSAASAESLRLSSESSERLFSESSAKLKDSSERSILERLLSPINVTRKVFAGAEHTDHDEEGAEDDYITESEEMSEEIVDVEGDESLTSTDSERDVSEEVDPRRVHGPRRILLTPEQRRQSKQVDPIMWFMTLYCGGES